MRQLLFILFLISINFQTFSQNNFQKNKNIVFIHGAWSTGEVWSNYQNYFTEQGYNTISPTLLHHKNQENDSLIGVSMEDYVIQIREILSDFDTPPVIIAHSMGCIIAQRLASEKLISKMILIAPATNYGLIPPSETIKSVKWINKTHKLKNNLTKPTFEEATKSMLNNLPLEKQKKAYSNMTYESGLVMKEIIWTKNMFGEKPNKINYSKIDIPILFIAGGIDKASPVKLSEKLMKKHKTNSSLNTYKNNAHWMMKESNWKDTAEDISLWISKMN